MEVVVGAVAERRFHLFRGQPIPPSKVRYELFELSARLSAVIVFPDLRALAATGMNTAMIVNVVAMTARPISDVPTRAAS